jgi:hypothetical protein
MDIPNKNILNLKYLIKIKATIVIIEAMLFLLSLSSQWYYAITSQFPHESLKILNLFFLIMYPSYPVILLFLFNFKEIIKQPQMLLLLIFYPFVYIISRLLFIFSTLGSIDQIFQRNTTYQRLLIICLESLPHLIIQGFNNTFLDNWSSFHVLAFALCFISVTKSFAMIGIKATYKSQSISWIKDDFVSMSNISNGPVLIFLLSKIYKLSPEFEAQIQIQHTLDKLYNYIGYFKMDRYEYYMIGEKNKYFIGKSLSKEIEEITKAENDGLIINSSVADKEIRAYYERNFVLTVDIQSLFQKLNTKVGYMLLAEFIITLFSLLSCLYCIAFAYFDPGFLRILIVILSIPKFVTISYSEQLPNKYQILGILQIFLEQHYVLFLNTFFNADLSVKNQRELFFAKAICQGILVMLLSAINTDTNTWNEAYLAVLIGNLLHLILDLFQVFFEMNDWPKVFEDAVEFQQMLAKVLRRNNTIEAENAAKKAEATNDEGRELEVSFTEERITEVKMAKRHFSVNDFTAMLEPEI